MKHTSVKLDTPIEFINITPVNPLISKCQIKVCYVGNDPNRNRSVITKDVATKMANSIPGSPIVGYFNEDNGDFEEHNRILDVKDGKFQLKDGTRPYGFVDLNAKVWFQKFLDNDEKVQEYLMTEGYIWTGQYPEAKRIIEKGNNQSMELDNTLTHGTWAKGDKGNPEFFIINEAILSKLCILGEEFEPCFEGAGLASKYVEFSFNEEFKAELFSVMEQMKEILNEGGAPVISKYTVEIGGSLWNLIYDNTDMTQYSICGFYEEDTQTFAVLQNRSDNEVYRVNFTEVEGNYSFDKEATVITETYENDNQFSLSDVEAFEAEYAKKKKKEDEEEDKPAEEPADDEGKEEEKPADEDKKEEVAEGEDTEEDEEKKKKKKYNLEEVVEYVNLQNSYNDLETKYNNLVAEYNALQETNKTLTEFKNAAEKKEKQAMIDSFYMLSDEDKADVIANIDTYSLDDIEAKLSIICVRNKVSFDLDVDTKEDGAGAPTTYNLGDDTYEDSVPAWVKSLRNVAKDM